MTAAAFAPAASLAQEAPLKIGVVTFLSGPAASPFGVPARNAAEIMVEMLNGTKVPAPYAARGFGGAALQMQLVDESGPATTQVTEFRNLAQRENVDMVIGYVSSGNCLAVAPVAEELKKLTVFFDCGTPRIFEEKSYKYVFRTASTATMDSVGAALYVKELKAGKIKRIAGVNQNYAWGQDSWVDFEASMKQLTPGVQVATSQMPKLFAGQYNAEISTVLGAKADVVHSSFWDGDLEAFILQAGPRGLFKRSTVILTTGETAMYKLAEHIPDGVVIGARGPYGPYAPDNELNRWFSKTFADRYGVPPNYAAYQMAQAILGTKAAWEKAQSANGGKRPSTDEVIAAFERLTFESPAGKVEMVIGAGHQAITETAYGVSKLVKGKMTVANVKRYPATMVNPAVGLTLIYGVMKIVNVTHGSFYALGAYAAASITGALLARGMPPSLSYAVLLGSALLVSVIVAPLIERGILRFMYAKDEVVILLITYALFLILEDVIKMIWGVNPYFIAEPYGLLGSFDVLDLTYPYYNLILVGVAIACGAGLAWTLGSTRTGKLLVAVIHDTEVSRAMGINVDRMYLYTFTFGSLLAAIGGAFTAPTVSVVPALGVEVIVLSFAVVVIGGLGSLPGAALGAVMVGLVRSAAIHYLPQAELFVIYLVMAMVLAFRPRGLFSIAEARKI